MAAASLDIDELGRRCRAEAQRFLRGEAGDQGFCFELFERAVAQRDSAAWAAIVAQYRGLVLAYVGQHSVARLVREEDDFWVNRAFQRFWMAVPPERFARFPDVAALLRYLKLCVHSVLMDEARARRAGATTSLDDLPGDVAATSDAEAAVVGSLAGQQLWQVVLAEMQDPAEQRVAYLSFARDLKPAEIFEREPTLFETVADVYRIKRNVLERLRRSPAVRAFLDA